MNHFKNLHSYDIVSDRGFAKYFHGREEIIKDFNNVLGDFATSNKGTTFLIQGAPGVGKTALLFKFREIAKKKGWKVVNIKANALWNRESLNKYIGVEKPIQIDKTSAKAGMGSVAIAANIKFSKKSIVEVLKTGKQPLLLTLDEAQTLGTENYPPATSRGEVIEVLDSIHNGELERGLVFVVSGLGITRKNFKSFGISRFNSRCFHSLSFLEKKAERDIINDWLKKEGDAKGDPTLWIDTIANETHQWAHHVVSYVNPAINLLKKNDGHMTSKLLKKVLIAGRQDRYDYYEGRVADFDRDERQSIVKAFVDDTSSEGLTRRDIVFFLEKVFDKKEAVDLFDKALLYGVISLEGDAYKIPIPSMKRWLLSKYS